MIHYIVIPKAQDAITFGFKKRRSLIIVFLLLQMLATIQLNDQFCFW